MEQLQGCIYVVCAHRVTHSVAIPCHRDISKSAARPTIVWSVLTHSDNRPPGLITGKGWLTSGYPKGWLNRRWLCVLPMLPLEAKRLGAEGLHHLRLPAIIALERPFLAYPTHLPAYMSALPTSCLPACLHACLPACLQVAKALQLALQETSAAQQAAARSLEGRDAQITKLQGELHNARSEKVMAQLSSFVSSNHFPSYSLFKCSLGVRYNPICLAHVVPAWLSAWPASCLTAAVTCVKCFADLRRATMNLQSNWHRYLGMVVEWPSGHAN
jgi:hypothetical protein